MPIFLIISMVPSMRRIRKDIFFSFGETSERSCQLEKLVRSVQKVEGTRPGAYLMRNAVGGRPSHDRFHSIRPTRIRWNSIYAPLCFQQILARTPRVTRDSSNNNLK